MNQEPTITAERSAPIASAGAWDLRHPGLIMKDEARSPPHA